MLIKRTFIYKKYFSWVIMNHFFRRISSLKYFVLLTNDDLQYFFANNLRLIYDTFNEMITSPHNFPNLLGTPGGTLVSVWMQCGHKINKIFYKATRSLTHKHTQATKKTEVKREIFILLTCKLPPPFSCLHLRMQIYKKKYPRSKSSWESIHYFSLLISSMNELFFSCTRVHQIFTW